MNDDDVCCLAVYLVAQSNTNKIVDKQRIVTPNVHDNAIKREPTSFILCHFGNDFVGTKIRIGKSVVFFPFSLQIFHWAFCSRGETIK